MKTCLTPIVTLLIAGMLSANGAPSASTSVETLSLDQAITLCAQHHPELVEARALIEAARGRKEQGAAFPNPELVARIESAPFSGRILVEAEYLIGFSQAVPLGDRLSKARVVGKLEEDRRQLELNAKWAELRRRVHGSFAIALYQDQAVATQGRIVELMENALRVTEARRKNGDAIPADVARVEIEVSRERAEVQRAELLREQSRIALLAAIGNPKLNIKSLAGDLEAVFELPALESLAASIAGLPEIAAAEADAAVQTARLDLAKAKRIPDVNVELLYRRIQAQDENAFDVGIRIPWPIFDNGRGNVREAQADLQAAQARAISRRNEIGLGLRETYAQLKSALNRSRMIKAELLPRAEMVLKVAETRFAAGDAALTETLPIRRDWAVSQLFYQESLRDVMQAWAQLSPLVNRNQGAF